MNKREIVILLIVAACFITGVVTILRCMPKIAEGDSGDIAQSYLIRNANVTVLKIAHKPNNKWWHFDCEINGRRMRLNSPDKRAVRQVNKLQVGHTYKMDYCYMDGTPAYITKVHGEVK